MKKKPVIDYGWTSFKYALLLVIAVVIGITYTYLFYRKKASALYIAEELYKYEDLNISGFEEILSKDLKKELTPGIETKVILYNDEIKSFDGYLGVVEVYNSEPYARIRRSSLKYANMYYDSLTNDYTFLMNNNPSPFWGAARRSPSRRRGLPLQTAHGRTDDPNSAGARHPPPAAARRRRCCPPLPDG